MSAHSLSFQASCDESAVTERDACESTLSQNLVLHTAVHKRTRQFLSIEIVREAEFNPALTDAVQEVNAYYEFAP